MAYPLNAYIRWNGGSGADWDVYAALVDGATAEPGTDPAQWALVSPASIAAFKASQTQTNQGTGLLLTGAAEVAIRMKI